MRNVNILNMQAGTDTRSVTMKLVRITSAFLFDIFLC